MVEIFNFCVVSLNYIFQYAQIHYIRAICLFGLIFFFKTKKDIKKSKTFLYNKTGMIIIDGKFEKGKNRFMTNLSREAKTESYLILSNFYMGDTDIRWNSLSDLRILLNDVWQLGEYQNFTREDLKKMYSGEGQKRLNLKLKENADIGKKYVNIPHNGFFNRFLFLADEFQNLFYNRESMSNFTGENKRFLKLLHQVRHFNSLLVFATQSASDLDVKFRKLSTYYITMTDWLRSTFFGYYVYEFMVDKQNNLDIEKAKKFTKLPAVFFNGYIINKIINKVEKKIKRKIKFRFFQLDFYSKFNADPDYDIYKQGDLFRYLDKLYLEKKHKMVLNID